MEDFKREYNQYLRRFYKGEKWVDNPCRTEKEVEKGINLLQEIIRILSVKMQQFKDITGREMTTKEALRGFK